MSGSCAQRVQMCVESSNWKSQVLQHEDANFHDSCDISGWAPISQMSFNPVDEPACVTQTLCNFQIVQGCIDDSGHFHMVFVVLNRWEMRIKREFMGLFEGDHNAVLGRNTGPNLKFRLSCSTIYICVNLGENYHSFVPIY